MTVAGSEGPSTTVCANHPRRETAVRCGKCGKPICTRCMISTPVGMRCRDCAQLRRLPQFDIGPGLLLRSFAAGLALSVIAWYIVAYIPFFRFFAAIIVGLAVGEAMSRLSRRRSNLILESGAVLAVIGGYFCSLALLGAGAAISSIAVSTQLQLVVLLPVVLAAIVAVVKLR